MVDKAEYKIPTTNLIPPEGWKTQLKFQLTSEGRTTPLVMVQDFTYNLDISTSTGDGTLTLALDDVAYMKLRDNDEFQIFWGWSETGDLGFPEFPLLEYDEHMNMSTEHIPMILTGYIKDVKRSGDNLVIDFFDKGVLMEGTDPDMNYPNSTLGYIIDDIALRAGIGVVYDWMDDPAINIMITYPAASETAAGTTGDTGAPTTPNTVYVDSQGKLTNTGTGGTAVAVPATPAAAPASGTAPPPDATTPDVISVTTICSCGLGYVNSEQHSFKNHCPRCGRTGSLQLSWKQGQDIYHQEITCGPPPGRECGADYCGVHGNELSGGRNPSWKLEAADASASGAASTAKSTSYWETLMGVLTIAKVDLMAFVHLDTLYVIKIPNSDKPPIFIDDRLNVVQDSVTVTDPRADKLNKIVVSYGNTAKKQTVYASYPDMVMKYGEKVQELKQPKLNEKDATDYAVKQLNIANRTDGFSIDCTILGTPYYYPNHWCNTLLTRYDVDKVMFLSRYVLKFSADKIPTADISLVEYYPDLSVQTSSGNDITGTGTGDLSALAIIAAEEAKFGNRQGSGSCVYSYMACMLSSGYGDCWAHSYWCYDQMTKAGIKARICCGNGGCKAQGAGHRWAQYWNGTAWADFPFAPNSSEGRFGRSVDGILPHPEDHEGNGM